MVELAPGAVSRATPLLTQIWFGVLFSVQPRQGPQIHGLQTSYQVGERLRLNCTLAGSKPAAALNWYINEEKVGTDCLPTGVHLNGALNVGLSHA